MRTKIKLASAGTPRLYRDYVAALISTLKSTNTLPETLLNSICTYSSSIPLYEIYNDDNLTVQGFSTAAYALLSNRSISSNQSEINIFNGDRAKIVVQEAEGVVEDWMFLSSGPQRVAQAELSFFRTIADSGLYQQEVLYKVTNTLVLSGFKRFEALAVDNKLMEDLFKRHVQVSAFEYYLLLFGIWCNSQAMPIFKLSDLLSNTSEEIQKVGRTICGELSKTPSAYNHQNLDSRIENLSAKFRGSAYFSMHPFISVADDTYACIAHPFLRTHITSKYIQKSLLFGRIDEPNAQGRTKVAHFLGNDRLESYFRELCNVWAPPGGHHDEYFYSDGMESADRIIFETVGGVEFATLVQLKLKSLPTEVHFSESWERISRDFALSYSDCIFKSLKYLFKLSEKKAASQLNNETLEISEKVLACSHFCFIGIVPDLPPIFTINYVRRKLEDEVSKKIEKEKNKNFKKWFQTEFPDGYLWHIMDLTDFQYLMSSSTPRSLAEEICIYVHSSGVDDPPLQNGTAASTFKNYLIGRLKVDKIPFHPKIHAIFTGVVLDMQYLLFKGTLVRWLWTTWRTIEEKYKIIRHKFL